MLLSSTILLMIQYIFNPLGIGSSLIADSFYPAYIHPIQSVVKSYWVLLVFLLFCLLFSVTTILLYAPFIIIRLYRTTSDWLSHFYFHPIPLHVFHSAFFMLLSFPMPRSHLPDHRSTNHVEDIFFFHWILIALTLYFC